jgi:multicomponent K+:H+ antiporter subunit D
VTHWIIVPVILPGLVAAAILLLARGSILLHRALSLTSTVVTAIVSFGLVLAASWGGHEAYWLGSWPPPFGIVLVLDRLSALLVATTSIVALASVLYAAQGWDEKGANFHALFQFQLMGLNGAFLTGDLFNLFVFFEVLLIASYGLLLHGGGKPRVRAGVHYVLLNLAGSAFFVLAVALLYGLTGTLNMADLAVRVPRLPAEDAGLVRAAGLLLMAVFSVKAAMLPLHFWLPGTYGSASAPVAALFAIMTKVGGYAILRMYTLVFGEGGGHAAMLAEPWILPVALVTVTVGMLGALASRDLRGLVAFLVLGSVGTMMVAVGLFNVRGISAGLYYFVHSTVAAAALFLLAEMVSEQRGEAEGRLEPSPDVLQPRLTGGLFLLAGVAMVGLPPLSGFIGKLLILDGARHSALVAWVWAIVLATSLIAIIAAARAGSIVFWKTLPGRPRGAVATPTPSFAIVAGLVAVTALMTLLAGPITAYTDAAAAQLLARTGYIHSVLGTEALALIEGGTR